MENVWAGDKTVRDFHEFELWHKLLQYGLSPSGEWAMWRIHLRKHRRGAVDKVNAAHVAGRAETAQIAHNAAADGHQQILAVHAERQHSLERRRPVPEAG